MKIVIPGGSGHVGAVLVRGLSAANEVVVLSRRQGKPVGATKTVAWDGKTLGDWQMEIDGADVVINLAGRSVNCCYDATNLKEMMDSRVESTRAVGQAIAAAKAPPTVWLQASTATIYAHRFDAPNDETTGIVGGDEPGAPSKWVASIAIAKAWERALDEAPTPNTRKVALRSAMTMSPDKGSVFDTLSGLARHGLAGTVGNGRQYVSWIHERDFVRAVQFLIERKDLSGAINVSSPNPLPYRDFAAELRHALGVRFGLPCPAPILELGCQIMKTESELVLKSRRVVPTRLLEAGFKFEFLTWPEAARDLAGSASRGVD